MMPLLVVLAFLLFAGLIVIGLYNGLVRARARVRESASTVDTELQRRHELVPNLVNTVKGYMTHERELLAKLVALREQAERLRPGAISAEQVKVEGELEQALSGLRARFEAYPELKASANFQALQGELANTADRVQGALRFYNGNVRELNVKCESFPSTLLAGMCGFRSEPYFELADPGARANPVVQF
ncbi:MAG: LemA family protein [Planctomycetes bacterium]|nr:LemA family protein [Planctomycetota bacterium]